MRKIRKLLTVFAAFFLVLGLTTNVQAEQGANSNTGSITVENAVVGKTYSLYQLLTLESYNTDNNAYAYKVTDKWREFFNQDSIRGENGYVSIDKQGYVTWKEGKSAAEFAKTALAYAEAHDNITEDGKQTAGSTSVVFENLNLGYYLLDSSAGALCSLQTTAPNVNIKEKNSIPTVNKEVLEDNNWQDKNDANIGDTVQFKATINVGNNTEGENAGAQNYVLHDTMSAGLTFGEVTKVELISNNRTTTVNPSSYTVKTTDIPVGETFNVEFTKAFCDTLKKNDSIIVYYNAKLNENAIVAGTGNPNTIVLEYGDKNDTSNKTEPSTTTTFTWPLGIFKYQDGDKNVALEGAEFMLSTSDDKDNNDAKIAVTKISNDAASVTEYRVDPLSKNYTIVTPESGHIAIKGLDEGEYFLHETKAPDGYNKLLHPVKIEIKHENNATGGWTYTVKVWDQKENQGTGGYVSAVDKTNIQLNSSDPTNTDIQAVGVANTTGALLPSTGGMGTTLLYTIGAGLIVISGILLITKKRMSHE